MSEDKWHDQHVDTTWELEKEEERGVALTYLGSDRGEAGGTAIQVTKKLPVVALDDIRLRRIGSAGEYDHAERDEGEEEGRNTDELHGVVSRVALRCFRREF